MAQFAVTIVGEGDRTETAQVDMAVLPRKGEYFTIKDAGGASQAYEVAAVWHQASPQGAMILVRSVGEERELLDRLCRDARGASLAPAA